MFFCGEITLPSSKSLRAIPAATVNDLTIVEIMLEMFGALSACAYASCPTTMIEVQVSFCTVLHNPLFMNEFLLVLCLIAISMIRDLRRILYIYLHVSR